MPLGRKRSAFRSDPGTGQRQRSIKLTDPWEGNEIVQQIAALVGNPVGWVKTCQQESTNARMHPYNGSANTFAATASANATTLQLASTALNVGAGSGTTIDPTGLGIIILDGNCAGDFRLISGWSNQGSRIISIVDPEGTARGITSNVTTSDHYELVHPVLWDSDIVIKSEFSTTLASAPSFEIRLWYADLGRTMPDVQRASVWAPDLSLLTGTNMDLQGSTTVGTVETSFYHGALLQTKVKGFSAIKVQMVTKPAAGTLSLWVGST